MARNTGPANAAPRWPEPREGQAASRPEQQPYPQQGYPQAPNPHYPYRDAPPGYEQGYDPYAANGHAHQQQPAAQYGHQPEPYPDPYMEQQPVGYPPASQGYAPPQSAQHYAPQFEPYQPPAPGAAGHGVDHGWDQSQQQHWQHAEPAPAYQQPAYQQPAPRMPAQAAAQQPAHPQYDTAAYGHQDPQYATQPYAAPQAAPQLRGATYDQTPAFDQAQGGWPAHPAAGDPYAHQEPAWGTPPGYEQHAYQGHPGYEQLGYDPRHYDQQGYQSPDYAPAEPYGYGEPAAAYPDPAADLNGYPPEPGFGRADASYAPPVHQGRNGYADEDYDPDELNYEDDQPSGRSRWVKVAALAAGALVLVGGGVYGYNLVVGTSGSGNPPLVRKAEVPSKIKPEDPGGKKFAHTDSKILGRLSDDGSKPDADNSTDTDNGGTRKVSTMVIGRDGAIVPSPDTDRPPPARLPQAVSPVPGMTIVDGFGGRTPSVNAQPSASAPSMVNAPSANRGAPPTSTGSTRVNADSSPPAKPVVIARTEPVSEKADDAEPPASAAPSRKVARAAPAATSQPAASASTSAGYVAVLASVPRSSTSRMDALKQFADLQQKYAAQLGGKTPDVQDANLAGKGPYHRLIVGPPGSKQEASRLCSELKSAGYGGCWIKSY